MADNLRDLWQSLALDGVGDLLVEARPGFVVDATARHPIFANAAGRRFLGLGPLADLGGEASLDPRLGERLARFAVRADAGAEARELLRVRDGLRTSLIALVFRRPLAGGPIVVIVETTAASSADARPEANLAPLATAGAMVALFDGHGDVVAAQGDHGAVEGLDEELERVLDEAETRAVVERDLAVPGGRRAVALVTLGSAADARRLLWIGPMVTTTEEARIGTPALAQAAPPSTEIDEPLVSTAAEAIEAPSDTIVAKAVPMPLDGMVETSPEAPSVDTFIDDAPFVAAAPLAFDAWDEDTEAGDAAWIAHASPSEASAALEMPTTGENEPTAPVAPTIVTRVPEIDTISEAAASAVTAPPIDLPASLLQDDSTPAATETSAVVAALSEVPSSDERTDDEDGPHEGSPDGFRFVPPGHAVKFVWLMDAERRFTLISPELEQIVGPAVTRLVGRPWSEVAAELGFDGDGVIAEALARRDTWSGRTVLWPVEGEALRVPVDLAALPAFDRGRIFAGFRGFGTCRADEPVPDPTGVGLRLRTPPRTEAPAMAALPAPTVVAAATEAASIETAPQIETTIDETVEAAFIGEITEVVSPLPAPIEPTSIEPSSVTSTTEPAPTELRNGDVVAADVAPAPVEPPSAHAPAARVAEIEATTTPVVVDTHPTSADEIVRPTAPRLDETAATIAPTTEVPVSTAPVTPRIGARTVADTAAIAAAVAAFTAAGAPKTGPARADAPITPRAPTIPVPTSVPTPPPATVSAPTATTNAQATAATLPAPAQQPTDRVVSLGRTVPDATSDNPRLSQPERVAFRQIAEALGARVEGDLAPSPVATVVETITEPPMPVEATASAVTEAVAPVEPPAAAGDPAPRVEPIAQATTTTMRPVADEAPATEAPPPSRPVDPRLLDRLPLAVAVIKDDTVAYANERFLDLLRYPDVATLEAAGGLDSLFAGEHVARRWDGGSTGRPMPLIARDGTLVPADANISTIPWADGSALMMTLTEVAPVPVTATPEAAPTLAPEAVAPRPEAVPAPTPVIADTPSNIVALPTPPLSVVASGPSTEAARIAELEAIVDTATDGVLVLDADGIVLSANAAAEALFGTERRVMIGRPLTERLAPESRRSAMDYLDGLARNGVASVLNDGREVIGAVQPEGLIPLFMTIGNISSGPVKKYCVVLRDIAQWKKAEEDLTTARRRAEEASIHKSDFLAKISHEIRTPLNAIIGFSELMIDERFGLIGNDRYKDYLRDIHVSGTHIMSLVNDLLDLSKVEAGKMDLRFEAVSLADVVSECVAMMQPQANRERIIIRSSLPVGVPSVVADPRSVRQVVLNLLSNAIKFTPAGGQVIVSTTLEDSGEVVMRVRDTGYGMTDKEMQTAMEPFRQLHTTRSRGGGTGLGLPLTKALVEANRAVFRIDSTVGQGTLVSIAFPVTRVLAS